MISATTSVTVVADFPLLPIFDFISLNNDYKERELEYALVEKIKDVLLELGKGFSFVGNQYMISTDNNDYYIDLLNHI